jgi:hypothetical protein
MRRLWRDYNLTIVAMALFFAAFTAWAAVAWDDYENEATKHGDPAEVGAYLARFWGFTLENWQSEFLHIALLVLLTTYFVHKGSAESRDSDDRMEALLERIEQRLGRLEEPGHAPKPAQSDGVRDHGGRSRLVGAGLVIMTLLFVAVIPLVVGEIGSSRQEKKSDAGHISTIVSSSHHQSGELAVAGPLLIARRGAMTR